MAQIKFFKVTTLPASLEPDSFYYVASGSSAEAYLTDSSGAAKAIGNSAMINALISEALAELPTAGPGLQLVATISERDTRAPNIHQPALFLVQDATGDSTVSSGSALYAWDNLASSFTKVGEEESLDLDLGTLAQQDANNVHITGGELENVVMDAGFF